jgi:uncharacterized protein (DUF1778 family)
MPVAETKSQKLQRPQKLQRIEARIRPDQKNRIERAASIRGTSISDFIVQHADEAARRTIQEHEVWTLNEAQSKAFVEACLNPRKPSKRLLAAAERYKRLVQPW